METDLELKCPKKIKYFIWLASHDRLTINSEFQLRLLFKLAIQILAKDVDY